MTASLLISIGTALIGFFGIVVFLKASRRWLTSMSAESVEKFNKFFVYPAALLMLFVGSIDLLRGYSVSETLPSGVAFVLVLGSILTLRQLKIGSTLSQNAEKRN